MKRFLVAASLCLCSQAQPLPHSPLHLSRNTQSGVFLESAGPRSVFLGCENGGLEGWLYPFKIFQDLEVSFRLEGYPADIRGRDIQRRIDVYPEYTVLSYSHSAFSVRQYLLCPRSRPALVSLFEVDSALPMTLAMHLRPKLRLMWPGALSTATVEWNEGYQLREESGRGQAFIGCPGAHDLSCMPYQEEPKDSLLTMEVAARDWTPLVVAPTKKDYQEVLSSIPQLAEEVANHYRQQRQTWLQLELPDRRLQEAYDWALVGMDKGLVENPLFTGPGLVAGFRTSGESERPGFAWFFGRDAMWTGLATVAAGDLPTTLQALNFLEKQQRQDGKIPHEISQSAPLVDWFQKYPYAWASSDATPLFLIVWGQLHRAGGDRVLLQKHWPAIEKAWKWTSATDRDGDGLMENTQNGHAWVEGGALYPAHQELYLQGVFLEAARHMTELAREAGHPEVADQARQAIERVEKASERTFWLEDLGHYAFATALAAPAKVAEPGPNRERRQHRLHQLASGGLVQESTVLPAVPALWGWLQSERVSRQLETLASSQLSTDWGTRLLSNRSQLYDPLAYHYGSVWPLFTGWVAQAGYHRGKPLLGWQALGSNAALTEFDTLGAITELLSGDYCSAFGRSSHHQVWSEAMLVWPLVDGLLGLRLEGGGKTVVFEPQPPGHWSGFKVSRLHTPSGDVQLEYRRQAGKRQIRWKGPAGLNYRFGFALTRDARPQAQAFTRELQDEVQWLRCTRQESEGNLELSCSEGSEISLEIPVLQNGQRSQGLRIVRCRGGEKGLELVVEGTPQKDYMLINCGRPLSEVRNHQGSLTPRGDHLVLRLNQSRGEFLIP